MKETQLDKSVLFLAFQTLVNVSLENQPPERKDLVKSVIEVNNKKKYGCKATEMVRFRLGVKIVLRGVKILRLGGWDALSDMTLKMPLFCMLIVVSTSSGDFITQGRAQCSSLRFPN